MSVLETFFFAFSSDAKQVTKGVDEATDASKKLEHQLVNTDKKAEELGSEFLSRIKGVATGLVGLFAIGALTSFATEQADAAAEVGKMGREVGVAVDSMEAYRHAISDAGGDMDDFNKTIENLKDKTKDPIKYLSDISDRFKGLSDTKAADLGEKLGLEKGVIGLMREGKTGLDELLRRQRELGVTTAEQAVAAKAYKDQLRDTNRVYEDVKRSLITVILPPLTTFLGWVEKGVRYMRDNKVFFVAFFTAIGAAITAFYLPAMIRAVVATYALIAPYLAIGAVIAAIGLIIAAVVDDVVAFVNGQNSLIGEISKKWPIVGDIVKGIAAALLLWWEVAKSVFGLITDAIEKGPEAAFENFKERVLGILDALRGRFPVLAEAFLAMGQAIGGVADFISNAWEAVAATIQKVIGIAMKGAEIAGNVAKTVGGWFGAGDGASKKPPLQVDDATQKGILAGQQQLATATKSPISGSTSNAISNQQSKNVSKNTNVTVSGPINVQTQATDANGVASGIGSALTAKMTGAVDHFDDGVAA